VNENNVLIGRCPVTDRYRTGFIVVALCLLPCPSVAEDAEVFELVPGLLRIEELSEEGSFEEAMQLGEALLRPNSFASWRRDLEQEGSWFLAPALKAVDPALDLVGANGHGAPERAAIHYARGVVQLLGEDAGAAKGEFSSARSLSGAGRLRLDSGYNLGTLVLHQGEEAFAEIPEVSGNPGLPPGQAQVQQGAPPTDAPEEDPLEKARGLYLEAKDLLVQRLRLDWRDPDTRANLELAQRRLQQLDEIEKQREEQQQEQEQEQDQEEPEDSEPKDDQEGDQEDQQDPGEQEEEPKEGEQEEQSEPEEQGEEQQQAQPEERYLTQEEVQRLLDMLKEYEEKGEEVRERLHQKRQRRTERDW
jgi:hypothetical protein